MSPALETEQPDPLPTEDPQPTLASLRRLREEKRLRVRIVGMLVMSCGLHGLGILVFGGVHFPSDPPLIEFRLIDPETVTSDPPPQPTFVAEKTTRDQGQTPRLDQPASSGGQPPQPAQAIPIVPTRSWEQKLKQAVDQQDWTQAMTVIDQMTVADPQQQVQFQTYRSQLRQLAAQPIAQPQPDPTPSLSTPLQTPSVLSEPAQPDLVPPDPVQPEPPKPTLNPLPPVPPLTPLQPMAALGSGGTTSGLANPRQAAPGKTSLAAKADLNWGTYLARLQRRVQQNWLINPFVGSHTTQINLTIHRNGQLTDVQLATTSDNELVDAAVLAALRRSAPFEPLPKAFADEQMTFAITVLSGSGDITLDPR